MTRTLLEAALTAGLMTLSAAATAWTPQDDGLTGFRHEPAPCMDTEAFPRIELRAESANAARRARGLRVRFRAETSEGWYEADLDGPRGTTFSTLLPKPLLEASRVVYFFQADAPEGRSRDYVVNVLSGGCPGALSASEEGIPDIRIERTGSSQSEIPPGFSPEGLASESGPGGATIAAVAAAAGGATIAAVIVGRDDGTPVAPPPLPSPEAPRACFMPDPIPDILSGDTIRFDATCTTPDTVVSYLWNFGDGTQASGSSVEHLFRPGGIYTVSLSVSDGQRGDDISRVIRVRATPSACFLTTPDPPRISSNESINFNGECSVGDRDGGPALITRYEWDFGDGRPGAEGVFVSRQFEPDVYGVTLTVTNEDGRQDAKTQFVVVEEPATTGSRNQLEDESELSLVMTSRLEPHDAERPPPSAEIRLNGLARTSTLPATLRLRARAGTNVVQARLTRELDRPAVWRFDFSQTSALERGSVEVVSGQVLARSGNEVAIRVPAGAAPVVRFRFRLSE